MKKLIVVVAFILYSVSSLGDKLAPTPQLKSGTAPYQSVIDWSKERIISEGQADYSSQELQTKLEGFPLITEENCGDLHLIFIQNTPQCGNINCPFLTFSKITNSDKTVTYRFIDEVWFAGARLYCFPHDMDYKYYLVTSYHESNEVSFLELNEIKQNNLQKLKTREINYSQKDMNQKMDALWARHLDEKSLLNFFNGSKVKKKKS